MARFILILLIIFDSTVALFAKYGVSLSIFEIVKDMNLSILWIQCVRKKQLNIPTTITYAYTD